MININCTFSNILLQVKSYFLPISIIFRLIPIKFETLKPPNVHPGSEFFHPGSQATHRVADSHSFDPDPATCRVQVGRIRIKHFLSMRIRIQIYDIDDQKLGKIYSFQKIFIFCSKISILQASLKGQLREMVFWLNPSHIVQIERMD